MTLEMKPFLLALVCTYVDNDIRSREHTHCSVCSLLKRFVSYRRMECKIEREGKASKPGELWPVKNMVVRERASRESRRDSIDGIRFVLAKTHLPFKLSYRSSIK